MTPPAAPPVSIGLPVYNGEAFLAEAVDSLLAQDFPDFELVIGDNASTDATQEICREAVRRDPRVSYHRSDRNRGAAWNFSRLLPLTRGRYFRWASHDDACEPGYLRRCLEVLQDRPDVSLAFAQSVLVDAQTRPLTLESRPTPAVQDRPAARARSLILDPYFPSAAPFGLTRREQILRTDLLAPYKGSDRTFLLQMALQGAFHEIPEPLYLHRRHPDRSVLLPMEQRLPWWDGGVDRSRLSHRARLVRGYVRAVTTAPVPLTTRLEVFASLPVWVARHVPTVSAEVAAMLPGRVRARLAR